MENDLIYVYCIVDKHPQIEKNKLTSGLSVITVGGYYVCIKSVSSEEFSEENLKKKFANIAWIKENEHNHIEMITTIMKNCMVIPFKFGTIFNTINSLEKFVDDYSSLLSENFETIKVKEEWSVKIYCDKKILGEQIFELSEEVRKLEQQILESSPGKAFLLKRKKNELKESEVRRLMRINGQKCYEEYRNISYKIHLNNLLPQELTKREEDMVLNATFFVDKKNVMDFVHIANLQEEEYKSIGFLFDVTGPCPPFSFASIKEL